MAGEPMMQPGMWANGVAQPNFSQPLMDFSQLSKLGSTISGKPQQQGQQQQPQPGMPMQLQPGQGQGQPVQPGQGGGAANMPFVQALMRMFGGGGAGPNMGSPGGTNPFGGGSGNAIY